MDSVLDIAKKAKEASYKIALSSTTVKNDALTYMAQALEDMKDDIISANQEDVSNARKNGLKEALIERLTLSEQRISGMIEGLLTLVDLPDPVGGGTIIKRPNGLTLLKERVPLGVIGIIYESRPNVTSDAAGLCIKSGNAVILRGGSEAINSNKAIVKALCSGLKRSGLPESCIQLIEDTDRERIQELFKMRDYVDVIIPRGGGALIKNVVENSKIPVIETGEGNCHIYVDEFADLPMAEKILINAKTSRPSVCNAAEKLLVHEKIAKDFLPDALLKLQKLGVEIRGCERTRKIYPNAIPIKDEDWPMEYLDFIIGVKVVDSIDEAIEHINRFGTRHSEAIVTKDYERANKFLAGVDAACVYVNASTRFTDGGEFGMGAEIGISTQKLHARGPMGLEELTTTKYLILGNGQIRE
ncbi:MAG TPA: glutamate-5-semialdehyde dehydrogenase [Tepidanaerobacter syntrophicus]|uniref:glutamate-5-semialdehyde dehydrogenase n=1 Tax=Tepidanaerobacter syntrophicus TaxID=224999 RepID=UPI00176726CD|nr:glutamate-5-semialdehyde dehydrogenase [Tepidanaerobacter syntrophicus]HHV83481.1 glutamate-5-semialdehyde dehydrogenase [Tepidanaerobacter syntrophicus]